MRCPGSQPPWGSFCCPQLSQSYDEGWFNHFRKAKQKGVSLFHFCTHFSVPQFKGQFLAPRHYFFFLIQSSTFKCIFFLGIPSAFWLSGIFLLEKQCQIESERSFWVEVSRLTQFLFPLASFSENKSFLSYEIYFFIILDRAIFVYRSNKIMVLSFFAFQNYGLFDMTVINYDKHDQILIFTLKKPQCYVMWAIKIVLISEDFLQKKSIYMYI